MDRFSYQILHHATYFDEWHIQSCLEGMSYNQRL